MLHAEVKELLTEALPGAQIACEGEAGKGAPCGKGNRKQEEAPVRRITGASIAGWKKDIG